MTSGYSADAAQDALRHLRHGRAVLVGDEAQVSLHRAHAELSHPEVAQPREDLLVEALAVCLQRRRTEVSRPENHASARTFTRVSGVTKEIARRLTSGHCGDVRQFRIAEEASNDV